jgi:putative glutamine amidotransferase
MRTPVIGITANLVVDERGRARHEVKDTYVSSVRRAGGIPLLLPAIAEDRAAVLDAVDGVILTGGEDIDTRPFGIPLHPKAEVMDPRRQAAEFALLRALDERPDMPLLGICLGMQLMGVHRGARLIQHLHDEIADGERHRHDNVHHVTSDVGSGPVTSWHHQAIADVRGYEVIGHSDDGVIEAIRDPSRPFALGVQWHPERTADPAMGDGVVRLVVGAARAAMACAR